MAVGKWPGTGLEGKEGIGGVGRGRGRVGHAAAAAAVDWRRGGVRVGSWARRESRAWVLGGCKQCAYAWRPGTSLCSHQSQPLPRPPPPLTQQQARTKSGSPRAVREARRRCKPPSLSFSLSVLRLPTINALLPPPPPSYPSYNSHFTHPPLPFSSSQHRPLPEEGVVRHQGPGLLQDPRRGQDAHHAYHRHEDRFRGVEGPCVRGEPG